MDETPTGVLINTTMNNTFKTGATYSAYQKISRLAIANGHSPLQYDNLVYVGFYNCGDIIKHEFKHNGVFVWFEDGLVNNDKSEDNSMTIASAPMNRIQELEHRIAMIKEDSLKLQKFITDNGMDKAFTASTDVSEEAWNHFGNIDIACDLNSNESLTWKPFTR